MLDDGCIFLGLPVPELSRRPHASAHAPRRPPNESPHPLLPIPRASFRCRGYGMSNGDMGSHRRPGTWVILAEAERPLRRERRKFPPDAVGAQFGHSRGSRKYPDGGEVPVLLSAPGPTRTGDPQVRSLTLYPAELRAQSAERRDIKGVRGAQAAAPKYRLCPNCAPAQPGVSSGLRRPDPAPG